eukprot:TRINITY_DN10377_c0_g1_i2.p1 TRINITY_DN10377_c0_g1~~TRINITY_DN10377_c0_g1_i2.p1  ORF type:complete len:295 (-),score=73.47 TRINITY_DN10377_c0_g1_i2:33-917(-)
MGRKNFEEAETILNKSLRICEAFTHPSLVDKINTNVESGRFYWGSHTINLVLAMLGRTKQLLGREQEAVPYFERMNQINEFIHTNEKGELRPHVAVITSLTKLGEAYYEAGDREKCVSTFEKVIALDYQIAESIAEKLRPTTAVALHYLGKIRYDEGNHEEARDLMERSWATYRHVAGLKEFRLAYLFLDLGKTYLALGNVVKAKPFLELAGGIFQTNDADPTMTQVTRDVFRELMAKAPHITGPSARPPLLNRDGIARFKAGETPADQALRREEVKEYEEKLKKWKKTHKVLK